MGWHSPVLSWVPPQDNEQVLHRGRAALEGKFTYCHLPGLIRFLTYLANNDDWLDVAFVSRHANTGMRWCRLGCSTVVSKYGPKRLCFDVTRSEDQASFLLYKA